MQIQELPSKWLLSIDHPIPIQPRLRRPQSIIHNKSSVDCLIVTWCVTFYVINLPSPFALQTRSLFVCFLYLNLLLFSARQCQRKKGHKEKLCWHFRKRRRKNIEMGLTMWCFTYTTSDTINVSRSRFQCFASSMEPATDILWHRSVILQIPINLLNFSSRISLLLLFRALFSWSNDVEVLAAAFCMCHDDLYNVN